MRWLLWCFCLLAESYETINHYHYHCSFEIILERELVYANRLLQKTFNLIWIIFKRCLFVEGSSGLRWAQVNVCVLGSFIFPNWQSFVWNYFRMRTVHRTGIHIQCSVAAVFNVRSRQCSLYGAQMHSANRTLV